MKKKYGNMYYDDFVFFPGIGSNLAAKFHRKAFGWTYIEEISSYDTEYYATFENEKKIKLTKDTKFSGSVYYYQRSVDYGNNAFYKLLEFISYITVGIGRRIGGILSNLLVIPIPLFFILGDKFNALQCLGVLVLVWWLTLFPAIIGYCMKKILKFDKAK